MDRVLRCECGFEARAAGEEALAATVRCHALDTHGMALSAEERLLLAAQAASTPREPTSRPDEEER